MTTCPKCDFEYEDADAWEAGYDQATREILDEVRRADVRLYRALLAKFAGWRKIMEKEPLQPW
jgi:hypothetical protein